MSNAKELPGKLSRVMAVTVNFRTPELALRCLDSLGRERAEVPLEALRVDNASGDGSVERLESGLASRGYGAWARVLASPHNGGFGAGNNLGLKLALARPDPPQYFLLVNPDAVLDPGALATLVAFLDEHPEAGFAGPRTRVGKGMVVGTAFRYPGILNSFDEGLHLGLISRLFSRWHLAPPPRAEAHRTDWLSGGCLLVRRSVFERVGLFDEGYFLYFEEVDLARRAERAGFQSWFVPAANILHESGASTGVTGEQALRRRMPPYRFGSRRRYFLQHRGLWNLRRWLLRAPPKEPVGFFSDFVRFNLLGRELGESR